MPKGAQDGSKMAQVGSKVGLEMRKVAKVKWLKKPLVFIVFRASWRSQDDPMGQLGVIWMAVG